MPDNTNGGGTARDADPQAVERADPDADSGGGSRITTGRQIGADSREMGDSDIVTTQGDEKGHGPTGGAER